MGHTISQMTIEELLQNRRRTLMNVWLGDVESVIASPAIQKSHVNRLHEIDAELARRGVAVA